MKKSGQKIIGIRLWEPPVFFESATEASKKLGIPDQTIRSAIRYGHQTVSGWCFDYAIN
jgi:hypothetical protein